MECHNSTFSKLNGKLPILAIFMMTNLYIYSSIAHKEQRFIGCLFPIASLYFATAVLMIVQLERNVSHYLYRTKSPFRFNSSPVKLLAKTYLIVFCFIELFALECRGKWGYLL